LAKPRRSRITNEILNVRRSLGAFDRALRRLAAMVSPLNGRIERRRKPRSGSGRTLHLSPQRRAALKLHGRYIGYVRQLKPQQKAQVRKIREAKAVRAAIARAREIAQE